MVSITLSEVPKNHIEGLADILRRTLRLSGGSWRFHQGRGAAPSVALTSAMFREAGLTLATRVTMSSNFKRGGADSSVSPENDWQAR